VAASAHNVASSHQAGLLAVGAGGVPALRFFLGGALLLSTASQFRVGPAGLGEILGLMAIIGAVGVSLRFLSPVARKLFLLFFLTWFAMGVGGLFSMASGLAEILPRDFIAIVYAQLVSWSVVAVADRDARALTTVLWVLAIFPLTQVAMFVLGTGLGVVDVWYGGDDGELGIAFLNRFMGWSTNPNQLGIALCALPFWLMFFLSKVKGFWGRGIVFIALLATVAVALLVQSNTVFVAWIAGTLAAAALLHRKYLIAQPGLIAVLTTLILISAFFFLDKLASLLSKGEFDDYNGRAPLWVSALASFAKSPLFGLGPGPHADEGDGRGGFEAHSLFLDFATQGGLVAVIMLGILFVRSVVAAIEIRSVLVLGAVIATFIECLAHNTQRHPMYWVYLVLPLVLKSIGDRDAGQTGRR
jgi:O-antigen ligase